MNRKSNAPCSILCCSLQRKQGARHILNARALNTHILNKLFLSALYKPHMYSLQFGTYSGHIRQSTTTKRFKAVDLFLWTAGKGTIFSHLRGSTIIHLRDQLNFFLVTSDTSTRIYPLKSNKTFCDRNSEVVLTTIGEMFEVGDENIYYAQILSLWVWQSSNSDAFSVCGGRYQYLPASAIVKETSGPLGWKVKTDCKKCGGTTISN